MARRNIAAGNWKMNKNYDDAKVLFDKIIETNVPEGVEVIMAMPAIYLSWGAEGVYEKGRVNVAAQNCHFKESGAYTGEVSATMLASIDVPYVLIGHSERREYFNEDDALLASKIDAALSAVLNPIFCCGEPLEIRKKGEQNTYVSAQVEKALFHLSAEDLDRIVIAYEPIWAIGTGETASPEQAQEMHQAIRTLLKQKYGRDVSDNMSILYGGSVKPNNAKEIFAQEDVDGGLVGGASLDPEGFQDIIHSFSA